jgi:hypothetical protein
MSIVYRNIHIVDVINFVQSIFAFYVILLIKFLLRNISDSAFELLSSRLLVCEIDTIIDDSSDGDSEEECINKNADIEKKEILEKKLLSFLIESNVDKTNKYKTPNGLGLYKINTAIVFKSKDNKIYELIRITNKLLLWCRLFPNKLYCADIVNLANLNNYVYENKSTNIYLFLVVEEYETGYTYKYIANLTTKKIIPSYKDIMFSKIQIQS